MTDDQELRTTALRLAFEYESVGDALEYAQKLYEFMRGPMPQATWDDVQMDALRMQIASEAETKQKAYAAERATHQATQREADNTDIRGIRLHCGPHCRVQLGASGIQCDCGELATIKANVGKELDGNGERG